MKIFKTLLMLMCFSCLLTGCVNVDELKDKLTDLKNNETVEKDESKTDEDEYVIDMDNIELGEDVVLEDNSSNKDSVEQNTNTTNSNKDVKISNNWSDMEIAIDGTKFKLFDSYKDLSKLGWKTTHSELGYPDGYILNSRDYTYGTVDLNNEKYDVDKYKKTEFTVGFINEDTKSKDILECDIWSLNIDILYGTDSIIEKRPEIKLAKNITWGSTEKDIIKAYGECEKDNIYISDTYKTYEYQKDSKYFKLIIHNDYGLVGVSLKEY